MASTDSTGSTDHTSTTYDLLGRTLTTTDQRGVEHTYSYDTAGRLSADTATDLGETQGVDGSILRISTTYDDLGRVETVTSYGDLDGTTVVNQVEYAYDGWGNLIQEWQAHDGAVDPEPRRAYNTPIPTGPSGGIAKYVRLTDVIYPNSRDVVYGYGTTGSTDDIMSRLDSIGDGPKTYAAYTYLGAGQIVVEDYQQPEVKLDYTGTANSFSGFDRFGRIVDQVWEQYGSSPSVLDEYTYTYDRAGNRTAKTNALDSVLSDTYAYDDLGAAGGVYAANGTQQKTWSLDALGNNLSAGTYQCRQRRDAYAREFGLRPGRQHDHAAIRRHRHLRCLGSPGRGRSGSTNVETIRV